MDEHQEYEYQPQEEPKYPPRPRDPYLYEKPKKKKGGFWKFFAVGLCCMVVGCALGVGVLMLTMGKRTEPEEPQRPGLFQGQEEEQQEPGQHQTEMIEGQRRTSKIDISKIDTSKQMTPAEVYALNVHSTVGITTSVTTNYFGYQTTSAASGSGFTITEDGYILTNHHVIENSNSITVTMYDGATYEAKMVGYDASNDIAVLKVEAQDLTPVILGDSDNMNVGDTVLAIGNPLGELTFSLTSGLISAMDRQVTISGNVTMNLLQTDAAINSGNSGGALFNLYGEVIGVTNAKYSSSSTSEASIDNIGFAIPINSIRSIVQSIIEKGYISKPYIGVTVSDVSSESQLYGLPQGASIQSVTEGGPAELGGLAVGDIVTEADGVEITSGNDLVKQVQKTQPGDVMNLTVYRQGDTLKLTITVDEQQQDANAKVEPTEPEQSQQSQQQMPQYQMPQQSPFGYPFGYR